MLLTKVAVCSQCDFFVPELDSCPESRLFVVFCALAYGGDVDGFLDTPVERYWYHREFYTVLGVAASILNFTYTVDCDYDDVHHPKEHETQRAQLQGRPVESPPPQPGHTTCAP